MKTKTVTPGKPDIAVESDSDSSAYSGLEEDSGSEDTDSDEIVLSDDGEKTTNGNVSKSGKQISKKRTDTKSNSQMNRYFEREPSDGSSSDEEDNESEDVISSDDEKATDKNTNRSGKQISKIRKDRKSNVQMNHDFKIEPNDVNSSDDQENQSDDVISSDDEKVTDKEPKKSGKQVSKKKPDRKSNSPMNRSFETEPNDVNSLDDQGNQSDNVVSDSEFTKPSVTNISAPISVSSSIFPKEIQEDEYAHDTSDEEDIRNTVGNIPMKWYDEFPHIGYDVDGKKIMKPASIDQIDKFLSKIDDPNYWRTVKNKMTGEKVVLTDEDLEIIQRIQSGKYPTNAVEYEPFEDFFTHETMQHPVTNYPPHKRSFIPSKIEKDKVSKLVYAIKMGWIKPRVPKEEKDEFYMLWEKDVADESKRMRHYIPAPKRKLPGHEESYNPPPEYCFTKEEEEKWKEQEPEDRKLDFIPKKYSLLRQVPAYSNFIREAFERCLDLYLCPRQRKMRVNVDPNDLLPPLPKRKDLQPFPTALAIVYTGHTALVRCITVESNGQFLASGSDDQTVKIWEVLTGRCIRTIDVGGLVKNLAWCPSEALSVLLVAVDEKVYIINTKVGDKVVISNTDLVLNTLPENPENKIVSWSMPTEEQKALGFRLIINHPNQVKQVVWHAKGDYFATLLAEESFRSIVIHQLSKFRTQIPFKKLDGKVQCIMFHPLRPFFFVASQKHVKIYNLIKQEMSKKLFGNCKLISSMAAHPQGDNIIVGSYDCRVNWFDLELSTKPYKTFRHHKKAVRNVAFHKRYPLFASTSDDGNVIISHAMVYSDLLQNPSIHFVKALKGEGISLDLSFHPQRPWIFSASDSTIRLYS